MWANLNVPQVSPCWPISALAGYFPLKQLPFSSYHFLLSLFRSLSPRSHLRGLSLSLHLLTPDSAFIDNLSPLAWPLKATCAILFAESKTWKAWVIARSDLFSLLHFLFLFNLLSIHLYSVQLCLCTCYCITGTYSFLNCIFFLFSVLVTVYCPFFHTGCVAFISGCFYATVHSHFGFGTQKYFWSIYILLQILQGALCFLCCSCGTALLKSNPTSVPLSSQKTHAGALYVIP